MSDAHAVNALDEALFYPGDDAEVDPGGRLVADEPSKITGAIAVGQTRLLVTAAVFALAFLVVAARLIDVSVFDGAEESRLLVANAAVLPHDGARGDILDRNGALLATTLPSASLFADATLVPDADQAIASLMTVLPDLDIEHAEEVLATDRRFVWLYRNLTPSQQFEVNRLGIPGLGFEEEDQRFYPAGPLAAHIVGFTDVDGNGLAGIERTYDDMLGDETATVGVSIDLRLQSLVRDELSAAIEQFSAIGGVGLIMNANTSELLAMVSMPDFDPYAPGGPEDESMFNRATLGAYEMGSTFKIFNTAIALDSGAVSLRDGFGASQPIRIGRFTINDFHGENRWLTVPEIFQYSSNIGSARMAMAMGTDTQREYMGRLGMLTTPPIELGEVTAPLVPGRWNDVETMTISFGHGIAVSPIQLAAGVASVVNGGIYRPPSLAPGGSGEERRIFSEQTSDSMRRLMNLVVEGGTGRNANAEGYLVGGKTGTAEKPMGRRYSDDALISSFIAAFPIHSPEYVIFVMLDEPHGTAETYGYATGGWVAAPTVRRVIERMAPMVGLAPFDPTDPAIVDALALTDDVLDRGTVPAAPQ
ncbi:MAG: penicillin-binding protein 2 [Pseudomonadota bacterium]